jgi:hypothetical protein
MPKLHDEIVSDSLAVPVRFLGKSDP